MTTEQNQEPKGKFTLVRSVSDAGKSAFQIFERQSDGQRLYCTELDCGEQFAQQIIESLNSQNRGWIRVEDRLPIESGFYLVSSGRLVGSVYFYPESKEWDTDHIVTHWRELPEPPTDGKDGEL